MGWEGFKLGCRGLRRTGPGGAGESQNNSCIYIIIFRPEDPPLVYIEFHSDTSRKLQNQLGTSALNADATINIQTVQLKLCAS